MAARENSALTALSELRGLEADRQAEEDATRRAKEEAARLAREQANRERIEEEERKRRQEEDRLAAEEAAKEARDREERIRIQEAEARARSEQEVQLKQEQMRLDAQVKMHEKKQRPKWPIAVAAVAMIGLVAGSIAFKRHSDQAEAQRRTDEAQIAAEKAAAAAAMKRAEEKEAMLAKLQLEIDDMKAQQKELAKQLESATTEDQREEIKKKQDVIRKKIQRKIDRQKDTQDEDVESATKKREDAIPVVVTDDPLEGA
jgi:hypothetical protein